MHSIAAGLHLARVPQARPRIGQPFAFPVQTPVTLGGAFFRWTALVLYFDGALLFGGWAGDGFGAFRFARGLCVVGNDQQAQRHAGAQNGGAPGAGQGLGAMGWVHGCSGWQVGWVVCGRHPLRCGVVIFHAHPAMRQALLNLEESRIREVANAGMGRRDVLAFWFGESDEGTPDVVRQKALRLAGRLIECDPDVRGGDGYAIARDILDSGRALRRMEDIIAAQGSKGFDHLHPQLGPLTFEVCAPASGTVVGIDNFQIARVARLAGAPKVQGAGVDLMHKLGATVAQGDVLYRVHAGYPADLEFARQASARDIGYRLGDADAVPQVFVEF